MRKKSLRTCLKASFSGLLLVFAAFVAMVLLYGCGAVRRATQSTDTRDSVRIEYRTRIETVRDTVRIGIPQELQVNMTRDTSSHIETSAAVSDASVTDGILTHRLENKPQTVEKVVDHYIVHRDTVIVTKQKEAVETVRTVEVDKPLTAWQQFRLDTFWWLAGAVAMFIAFKVLKSRLF